MVRFNKRLRKFLSTPSARRATQCVIDCVQLFEFLSTPSARRATNCQTHDKAVFRISIHALREEGDAFRLLADPAGGSISIHALREEGDLYR